MANEARPCPCDIGDRMEYGELGQEVQIEHFKAYVAKPSTVSEKAVVVIHDIFGWQLPNTRYMADMLAANGYTAVCPDFFLGKEPWSPSRDWSTFMAWIEDKKSTNINKEVDALLRFLVKHCGAKRIGMVGFCWGGSATHHIALHYPEVSAGVSFYGIIEEGEDKYDLKSPTLFIFAENDNFIPLDQVSRLEAKLEEKCNVDYQVKVFPGQSHGFAHRKREDINPMDEPRIQEARTDMINWLNKYI
uniref:carboxymethylenebutenolidase homolog n=1 Tax=Doryrhamphus excisus TaxID=161450 RepID=UPI0025ADBFC0|nr:carboxymethylenebutenolidase homolog [Doryrhamphus excisus]XP_057915867.1 carboxymethylenebutenolidase homolog [Doryrhamphus excisus]XP_057915868.1 carboxymethylenebutenolidase homolog [Doryrhamphus excisus]XP_057915869.1 carboxymethylenebutenolidase homolog [Doryrhamphus excisus]